MDVQKYIKRLKFARADWSRNIGNFTSKEDAINFLNAREFFFGDPFVVKYTENGEVKLMLAIGKSENPEITADTTEVTGGVGPEAYELLDVNGIKDELERLWEALNEETSARTAADETLNERIDEEASARTAADEDLQEQIDEINEAIDGINDLILELSGATQDIKEITGEGWTDSPANVTLTDRIKKDEELMKIVWEFNHGGSGVYEPRFNDVPIQLAYDEVHNKLALVAGDITGATVQLGGGVEVFTRIEYVPEDEALRFCYKPGGNPDADEECFEVPVGELIAEWTVANTDTVELNKERNVSGQDVLTANVKISDDSDNMLAAKSDGLYVSSERIDGIENELPKLKTEVKLKESSEHLGIVSGYGESGNVIYEISENDIASKSAVDTAIEDIQDQISGISDSISDEVSARESIKLVELPQQSLEPDVKAAYVLDNNGNTGDTVIKIYKDSVIYKIYIGHVDDELVGPNDPTVVPGTGETAICFIYFNENGEYAISTNEFGLANDLEALQEAFNESQEVEALAINRLAEAINNLDGNIYSVSERVDELENDVRDNSSEINRLGDDLSAVSGDLQNTNSILGNIKVILNTNEDGHFTARFLGPHTSTAETYYDAINALDNAIVGSEDISRAFANSIELSYDKEGQKIVLDWMFDGAQKSSSIDVSDFVKDSFLESVQIVTREGVQYLEFAFRTYDGKPLPIYVPLSDLAVIYSAGDGIDGNELENNQVITVKIDEFARKNYLAKSANGLLVTGVTEEIQGAVNELREEVDEKISAITESLNEYVRKDEVEDHLDSASTLPVQNKVIYSAITELENSISGLTFDGLTGVTVVGAGDVVVNIRKNGLDVEAELGTLDLDDFVKYEDVEDHLDSASTLPVQNKVIMKELNDLKDSMSDLDEKFDNLSGSAITDINFEGSGNVVVNITKEGNTMNVEYGDIDVSSMLSVEEFNAYTASTATAFTSQNITSTGITAVTVYADEYQNLPTATTSQYGVVILDDELDINSANPVENSAITEALYELYDMVSAETQAREEADEEIYDAVSAETQAREEEDSELWDAINSLTANTLSDVINEGSGPVVVSVVKDGNDVVVTNAKSISGLTAITADVVSATTYLNVPSVTVDSDLDSASTNPVENRVITKTIIQNEKVISAALNDLNNRKADISYVDEALTGITIDVDDHLDSASTNPVENRVITSTITEIEFITSAALNDLNDRKANIEDIPVTINDLDGGTDIATKADLAGFLPLSGGTMTGNISGSTGNAIFMPGGFFQTSDERLKIFNGDIENALEKVKNIPTRYFYWKNMVDGPRQIGTSAQKVHEFFPEIVSGEDKLSVDYSKLAVVALAAIKELSSKVDELQAKLDELQK